jgi:acetoin utilization deacetylase AcuC-like enzyme
MPVPLVFHPDYVAPLRPGHPFPMSKYGYLREALVARRILPPEGGTLAPAPIARARAAAVHDLAYVERVANGAMTAEESRRIGLPNSAAVARRAFLSAGGTLLAARLALETGLAANLAGGSHHAGPEGGAGYCVLNDVAIAARTLLDEGRVRRILVVDCDVHQGDGTARIFAGEPRVRTVSLHAARNYPARKAVSDDDYPLPDLLGDRPYLETLDHALAEAASSTPDLVFYNAGVDPPCRRSARSPCPYRRGPPRPRRSRARVGSGPRRTANCRARRWIRQRPRTARRPPRDPLRGGGATRRRRLKAAIRRRGRAAPRRRGRSRPSGRRCGREPGGG